MSLIRSWYSRAVCRAFCLDAQIMQRRYYREWTTNTTKKYPYKMLLRPMPSIPQKDVDLYAFMKCVGLQDEASKLESFNELVSIVKGWQRLEILREKGFTDKNGKKLIVLTKNFLGGIMPRRYGEFHGKRD